MSLPAVAESHHPPQREAGPAPLSRSNPYSRTLSQLILVGALGMGALACEGGGAQASGGAAADVASSVSAGSTEPAAELSGETITLAEVDAQVARSEMPVIQELYDARRRAINAIAEERLFDAEAERLGLTREQLIEQEINGKVPEVTDDKIDAFYEENKQAIGSQSLDDLRPRIRSFLSQRGVGDRRREFVAQLKEKAGLEVFLEPPRQPIEVAANEPSRGPADAPVTIVEYSDFECPFCARVLPTLQQVTETYGDQVRIVYRDYPLAIHANAQLAAEAAQCAHLQDQFWAYHDKLFENQRALDEAALKKYAADLELDTKQFTQCLDERTQQAGVVAETSQGNALGVTGTPAFFINGRFISGALPLQNFKDVIEDELSRSGIKASKDTAGS